MTPNKPILQLAPHELARHSRADLDGEPFAFRADWFGRERDFVGQVVGQINARMIFFALADEPERGNFVSASVEMSARGKPARPIYQPSNIFRPEGARQILENTANQGWGRLYYLDEDLNLASGKAVRWRLFLARSGLGYWCGAPDYYHHLAMLRWNENAQEATDLALLPPLELLERVRPQLLEPQSDAALARQFASMDHTMRQGACHPLTRGSYEEWEQVLGWYLRVQLSAWASEGSLKVDIYNVGDGNRYFRCSWRANPKFWETPTRIAEFCDWAYRYFAPRRDEDYLRSCRVAAKWANGSFSFRVDCQSPTQHGRLEALLNLRDWLRDKATPAEIEQLLRAE